VISVRRRAGSRLTRAPLCFLACSDLAGLGICAHCAHAVDCGAGGCSAAGQRAASSAAGRERAAEPAARGRGSRHGAARRSGCAGRRCRAVADHAVRVRRRGRLGRWCSRRWCSLGCAADAAAARSGAAEHRRAAVPGRGSRGRGVFPARRSCARAAGCRAGRCVSSGGTCLRCCALRCRTRPGSLRAAAPAALFPRRCAGCCPGPDPCAGGHHAHGGAGRRGAGGAAGGAARARAAARAAVPAARRGAVCAQGPLAAHALPGAPLPRGICYMASQS
jgi:hypothetical protein